MKKIFSLLFVLLSVLTLASCTNKKNYDIVSTSFVGYDFSKAIAPDLSSTMLLKPGEELHGYSPSVSDIEMIINSKLFIYIGGESDSEFVENDILKEIDTNKTKVINMMEVIKEKGHIYGEEDPESSINEEEEEEEEYDEHIWNSISNAKLIVEEIFEAIRHIFDRDKYVDNYCSLNANLDDLDSKFKSMINNSNKKLVVFADRFPLLYFVKEYNLKYDAAFKGCDTSKEANPKVIEKLTKKVIDNDLSIIFTIELSEANIADVIINNCKKEGKNVLKKTFYTMHNVSKEDYKKGLTYIDYMNMNYEVLKEALK